jgi:hypothetical protein
VDGFTVTNRNRTLQIMREMKESEVTSLPVRKTIIALLLSLGLTERVRFKQNYTHNYKHPY